MCLVLKSTRAGHVAYRGAGAKVLRASTFQTQGPSDLSHVIACDGMLCDLSLFTGEKTVLGIWRRSLNGILQIARIAWIWLGNSDSPDVTAAIASTISRACHQQYHETFCPLLHGLALCELVDEHPRLPLLTIGIRLLKLLEARDLPLSGCKRHKIHRLVYHASPVQKCTMTAHSTQKYIPWVS